MQIQGRLVFGELFSVSQFLGDGQNNLVIALGFTDGMNSLLLEGDALEVGALPGVGDDVFDFQRGVGRQDDVGVDAFVFQPGVLGDDAFDRRVLEGVDRPVAMVPAGNTARRIRPDHVHQGAVFFIGIGVADELVFRQAFLPAVSVKDKRRFDDGVLNQRLWNQLWAPSVDGGPARLLETLAQVGIEETDAPEPFGPRHPEVTDLALVYAGTAKSLHAKKDAFQAARLMRERTSDK